MGWREAGIALLTPREKAAPADEERATYRVPASEPANYSNYLPIITPSTAAQSVAIRSTTDLIASLSSELPITVYTGDKKNRRSLPTPGNLEDPGGDGQGREDWGYRILESWLTTGNAFGNVLERSRTTGRMQLADIFAPDQVAPQIRDGKPVWYVNGQEVPAGEFAFWRVNPRAGRLLGLSPIEAHAATIGISLATTRFGRGWFNDGAHSSGVLAHDGELTPEETATAKARYLASLGTREPIVIAGKWSWEAIGVSPEESQFLQTQGMSEAQCARIFGPGFAEILGYETGSKMTYGNVVDRRQDLLVLGIGKWFRRYERLLSKFLPDGQWVELTRDAMLESSTLQRYQAHGLALSSKWKTINEVRENENQKPVPWGDVPWPGPTETPTLKEAPVGNSAGS